MIEENVQNGLNSVHGTLSNAVQLFGGTDVESWVWYLSVGVVLFVVLSVFLIVYSVRVRRYEYEDLESQLRRRDSMRQVKTRETIKPPNTPSLRPVRVKQSFTPPQVPRVIVQNAYQTRGPVAASHYSRIV